MGAIDDRLGELGLALPAPPGVTLPFDLVRVHGGLDRVTRSVEAIVAVDGA